MKLADEYLTCPQQTGGFKTTFEEKFLKFFVRNSNYKGYELSLHIAYRVARKALYEVKAQHSRDRTLFCPYNNYKL